MKEFTTSIELGSNLAVVEYDSKVPSELLNTTSTIASIDVLTSINSSEDKCFIHPMHFSIEKLKTILPETLRHLKDEGYSEAHLLVPATLRQEYSDVLKGAVVTYFTKTDSFLMKFNTDNT